MKPYSLKKSEKILNETYKNFKRYKQKLSDHQKKTFQHELSELQKSIWDKDKKKASDLAHGLKNRSSDLIPKSFFHKTLDFVVGIVLALIVALLIRQVWFELYSIPSGSMRPTLKEKDALVVTKTPFGINTPWRTGHFLFDENSLVRGTVVIFTAQDLDIADPNHMYFYLIPGKKQLVKRLIGKPGDTLYFYGGEIYGIDREGNEIQEFQKDPFLKNIEHIPFMHLDGKIKTPEKPVQGVFPSTVIYQMNQPVAKLTASPYGNVEGKMLGPYKGLENYFDLWGFKNYAVARILNKEELLNLTDFKNEDANYYLQLIHHPTLQGAQLGRDGFHRLRAILKTTSSIIPLTPDLMQQIMDHMTTARFQIKDGHLFREDMNFSAYLKAGLLPKSNAPDGVYEFEDGKAYKILFAGFRKELSKDHPLYNNDPQKIQLLFNLGFEFNNIFTPHSKDLIFLPSRFAYFKENDLYLSGHKFLDKNSSTLQTFLSKEREKSPGFVDHGPPKKEDGSLDSALIKKYGITIPDRMYLVLGDNHAMSADSRDFGYVPEENLRGKASFIFFPISNRWGLLPQPKYPILVLPRIIIWVIAFIVVSIIYVYVRKKRRKPLNF